MTPGRREESLKELTALSNRRIRRFRKGGSMANKKKKLCFCWGGRMVREKGFLTHLQKKELLTGAKGEGSSGVKRS